MIQKLCQTKTNQQKPIFLYQSEFNFFAYVIKDKKMILYKKNIKRSKKQFFAKVISK